MPTSATIRFVFSVLDEHDLRAGGPIMFDNWLPFSSDDAIVVVEKTLSVRLWIDKDCVEQRSLDGDGNPLWANTPLHKVLAEVSEIAVSDALAELISSISQEHDWTEEHLNATYDRGLLGEYGEMGRAAYVAALGRFNRLLAYVRALKGQYWIRESDSGSHNIRSEFVRLRAKVKLGESSEWVRLCSPRMDWVTLIGADPKRMIDQSDWKEISRHVAGERKAPLVGQLLTSADGFLASGHRRAALMEAVSALEVAISQFSQRVKPDEWSTQLANRTTAERFQSHVNHIGMTCTISYLLPVLYPEEKLPGALLASCRNAIEERNAIVHRGQRDVEEKQLNEYLDSIRQLCAILKQLECDEGADSSL